MSENKTRDDVASIGAWANTHEAVCAERWRQVGNNLHALSLRIAKLEGLVWVIAGTLICGMAGLIVTLALRH